MLKKCLLAALTLSGASLLSLTNAASAAEWYPPAYEATYESKAGPTTINMHMYSDGKGLSRTDSEMPGGVKSTSIMDYPKKLTYTIMEKPTKTIYKTKLTGDMAKMDADWAKTKKATDLGVKTINGRSSHGWGYKSEAGDTETWVDEKQPAIMTKNTTKTKSMTSEMNLKSLTLKTPDNSMFKVPTDGYKVVSQ